MAQSRMPPRPGDPWTYPWGPFEGRAVELCPPRMAVIWLRSRALYRLDPEFYCALHRLVIAPDRFSRIRDGLACACGRKKQRPHVQSCVARLKRP